MLTGGGSLSKDAIDAKYGEDVVPGASWKLPVFDPNFDPHIPDKQPQPNYEDDFYPLKPGQKEPDVKNHFYNQLMRIPQISPPTPREFYKSHSTSGKDMLTERLPKTTPSTTSLG